MIQQSAHPSHRESGQDARRKTWQEAGQESAPASGLVSGHVTGAEAGQEIQQEITPDLCVIGGDAAGLATASAAVAFGVSVVLVENGDIGAQRDGGALSSKALLAAAAHVNAMRTGAHFGVKTVRFGVDFNAARAHVQDTLDAIAPLQSRERLKGLGVRVVTGAARFIDRKTLAVAGLHIKAGALSSRPARYRRSRRLPGSPRRLISPAKIFSNLPNVRGISLSLAPARLASKWRKRFGILARMSPCSIRRCRLGNMIRNAPPSC